MQAKTIVQKDGSLSVPVFDGSYTEGKKNVGKLLEPETIRNSMLQKMYSKKDLESLLIVKIDKNNPNPNHLRNRTLDDGVERSLMFSSGGNYYFGDDNLKAKIQKLFETEPDSACRYGSLLVSNCMEGCERLKPTTPFRIKVVDYKDEKYAEFETGDCHGKISPALAKEIGGKNNRAIQFRLGWQASWNTDGNSEAPENSFIAKGTVLPDKSLTTDLGYDMILDRSSVKGINKKLLDEYLPCGDYELPKLVLGNRENSKVNDYKNSWQLFGIWCSEDAQRKDLVPETQEKAKELAELQSDPIKLAKHIVNEYDKQQAFKAQQEEETSNLDTDEPDKKKEEMGMIKILRSDKLGLVTSHPAVVDFMKTRLANLWKELAINSGVKLSSGMTLPCPDLPRGTICAGHLPDGEDIVLTRYPVLNKDNIRKYTNEHRPELTKTKGVIWVNPEDFEEFHQGDFDGDKAAVKRAKEIPNIAKEIRRAGENATYDFIPVIQAQKVPYTGSMQKIATASLQQKVGIVATNIGRVASAIPNENENEKLFRKQQKKLIIGLSIMEQYEVDYQKNSLRGEDAKEIKQHTGIDAKELLMVAKEFCERHPSLLFDFKNDERLYKTFPLPVDNPNPINVLAREGVNPYWEETLLKARPRDEFQDLLPEPKKDYIDWKEGELSWAQDLIKRTREATSTLSEQTGNDKKAFKEEIGKLYDTLRTEILDTFETPLERMRAATALYRATHTKPNPKHRTKCHELAEKLEVAFDKPDLYQLLHEAAPREAYVLQVPFRQIVEKTELVVDGKFESSLNTKNYKEGVHYEKEGDKLIFPEKYQDKFDKGNLAYKERTKKVDEPNLWKEKLDKEGIRYEAVAHETLPLVEFAFHIRPGEKQPENVTNFINELKREYGNNDNLDKLKDDDLKLSSIYSEYDKLIIMPPAKCPWIETREEQGKAKLAFTLFANELSDTLENYKIESIEVVNVNNKNNAFHSEDFSSKQWRGKEVTVEIGAIELPENHPDYLRYHGNPIIQIDGQNLGTFSSSSPKLPIGSTFTATIEPDPEIKGKLTLKVDPESIKTLSSDLTNAETPNPETSQQDSNQTAKTKQSFQDELISKITETYNSIENPQKIEKIALPVEGWNAHVSRDGKCAIQAADGQFIYKGNIQKGTTIEPLSEAHFSEAIKVQRLTQEKSESTTNKSTSIGHRQHPEKPTLSKHELTLLTELKSECESLPSTAATKKMYLGISDWQAYIKPDGKCAILTGNKEPIYTGNLLTGKTYQRLNDKNLKQLEQEFENQTNNNNLQAKTQSQESQNSTRQPRKPQETGFSL